MTHPDNSIFSMLMNNSVHYLVIVSTPAIIGSVLLISFITRLNRKMLAWVSFLATGVLFLITGVTLLETSNTPSWGANIVLYSLINFAEDFAVCPLIFSIPAELFPTRYRASCHGISAASERLGAVLASTFLRYVKFGGGKTKTVSSSLSSEWLSYVFMLFAVPLFLAAGVALLLLPELQDSSGKSKTLEQLAEGRSSNTAEDAV